MVVFAEYSIQYFWFMSSVHLVFKVLHQPVSCTETSATTIFGRTNLCRAPQPWQLHQCHSQRFNLTMWLGDPRPNDLKKNTSTITNTNHFDVCNFECMNVYEHVAISGQTVLQGQILITAEMLSSTTGDTGRF